MNISTVSFDKAKIYKNRMFFAEYGKNSVSMRILDNFGNNIINRISYKPIRKIEGDKFVITQKKEYEIPKQGIVFEITNRIYDRLGKLINIEKEIIKV